MKRLLVPVLLVSLFSSGCKKDNVAPAPPPPSPYTTETANSSWMYQNTDTSRTPAVTNVTTLSTTRDTVVAGVSYHVYTNTPAGQNEYRRINAVSSGGNDYIELFNTNLDGGTPSYFAYIYLKDNEAAGAGWTQNTNVTVAGQIRPATIVNTIQEKAISRTVTGKAYTDVVHVQSVINTNFTFTPPPPYPPLPITVTVMVTQQLYYARKFGLIESSMLRSVSAPGFPAQNAVTSRLLLSADLK